MKEEYIKWYTPHLSKDFEMLSFGHAGVPVIAFATSQGQYYQNKDFGLVESARWFIENGLVKIYCPDSFDAQSWYNRGIHPADRVRSHLAFERVIINEVVGRAQHETGHHKVIFAGASFGGFHAINHAFKFPHLTREVYSMSGAYDMSSFLDGYSDNETYFNSPMAFLQGMQEGDALHNIRQMKVVLGVPEHDATKEDNFKLSEIMNSKHINHWFDFRHGANHDWPIWCEMFPLYLSKINHF